MMRFKWITAGAFFIMVAALAVAAIFGFSNKILAAALGGYALHDCVKKLIKWWQARPNHHLGA